MIYNRFLDSLFPGDCPVCGKLMPRGQFVCRECLPAFSFVTAPRCRLCGKQILTASQLLCRDCTKQPKSFTAGTALLNYNETAQDMMIRIKYLNRRDYIRPLARLTARQCGAVIRSWAPDGILPVPLHSSRLRSRGYNQAELIGEVLAEELQIPLRKNIIFRKTRTRPQKELSPEERLRNLTEAFGVQDIDLSGRDLLIVDDIYTTGSTMEACTRVLKAAGARKIYACSICIGSEI